MIASQNLKEMSACSIDIDVRLAALVRVPVLITSENRSDREMYARLIHANSADAKGPFVIGWSSHSTELAPDLSSSCESLRHRFDQARGGSLFIDDLATVTERAQHELMSFVSPCENLCSAPSAIVDRTSTARIIVGASRHLDVERAAGRFSERLFYRLNVIHIDLSDGRIQTAAKAE